MLWLQTRMMPATFTPGIISAHDYIVTQPWVALHYFLMFFAPVALSADSDQTAFTTIFSPEGIAGVLFLAALGGPSGARRPPEWRPVSFGLAWFLLALVPTSVYRLSELENDHRMFLPFVGLALAAGGAGGATDPESCPRSGGARCSGAVDSRRFASGERTSGTAYGAMKSRSGATSPLRVRATAAV